MRFHQPLPIGFLGSVPWDDSVALSELSFEPFSFINREEKAQDRSVMHTINSLKKTFALWLIASGLSLAEPAGLCMHAYGPEAPAEKIECFEYKRMEKAPEGYRFFLEPSGTAIVTSYRYRGVIVYKPGVTPGIPEFAQILKLYEETATATPSVRRYLNPKILAMRELNAAYMAGRQEMENMPKVSVAGNEYLSPVFKGFDEGKLVLGHNDGVVRIELGKITDAQVSELAKLDPKAKGIKIVEIAGQRLWNPRYVGITEGNADIQHEAGTLSQDLDSLTEEDCRRVATIGGGFGEVKTAVVGGRKLWNPVFAGLSSTDVRITHEKGFLLLEMDGISEEDYKTIMSWSNGTWKIAKPGFYGPLDGADSYRELVLEDGRVHQQVKIESREGDDIVLLKSSGSIKVTIARLANLPGIMQSDKERIGGWVKEILGERLATAEVESSSEQIAFRKLEETKVTATRARVLQVLDDGFLASEFVGNLRKGMATYRITMTKSAEHPVTSEVVETVIDARTVDEAVVEEVRDDLCFIVADTSNLVDDSIVNIGSMRLVGTYKYVDVRGAARTVRKYSIE
jgi:hypothetical protein